MKKSEPKSEIEIDEIKTILHQLQSMQVPTKNNAPQSNTGSPPSNYSRESSSASSAASTASAAPGQNTVEKSDYTIIAAFSVCFIASLIGGFFLYNNHSDIRSALKDFTNPQITGNRTTKLNENETEKTPISEASKPIENETKKTNNQAKLTAPYTSNTNPYPPKNNKNVKKAESLMKNGNIQEARLILTKEASKTAGTDDLSYVDIAFLLAQSYDPNYLSSLSFADSDADLIEAERWYRQWYQVASKRGIVKNQQSLQGILETLR